MIAAMIAKATERIPSASLQSSRTCMTTRLAAIRSRALRTVSDPSKRRDIETVRAGRPRAQSKTRTEARRMVDERRQARRARLGRRVDRQHVDVTRQKCRRAIFILGPEHRACSVDDPPAALDETHRALKRFVLIFQAL